MGFTDSDPRRMEFAAHIAELQGSLGPAAGIVSTARHFVYHEVVEGLYRLDDMERMSEYCYRELDEWPALGDALRKDDPGRSLPPVIACRDRLLKALLCREDYDAARRLASILAERRVVDTPEEVELIEAVDPSSQCFLVDRGAFGVFPRRTEERRSGRGIASEEQAAPMPMGNSRRIRLAAGESGR